jgi:DNA polymerase elongation subunit (family B)
MPGLEDFMDGVGTSADSQAATRKTRGEEDGGDERTLHLMQVDYEEQYGEPIVHLWARDEDGGHHWVEVEGHRPSFYIHRDAYSRRIENHDWVHSVSDGYQSIQGQPLVRVEARLPKHVSGGRDIDKGLREYFDQTWEADVFFVSRFLIDTGIKTHFTVDMDETWSKQYHDGDYRVDVGDIEPADPDWRAEPRMVTADIEVLSPDGFPEAADAEQPVTGITAHDNYRDEYVVWLFEYEGWAYDDLTSVARENAPEDIQLDETAVTADIADVRTFSNEASMLHDFNTYVEDVRPDLLSGWNSSATTNGDAFDYPYLLNRCKGLNVMNYRDWSPMEQVWTTRRGREQNLTMGAKGVGFFDMMESYQKTQWQEPKGGWGLENTTDRELPFDGGKLEIEDIDEAWKFDTETFIEYNIRDVQAVVGIDHTAGVTELFQNIRSLAGVQFGDCHNNIDLLDVLILRYAQDMGLALPTNEKPDRGWYYGAHVFEPQLGRHENVVYPDLWSMYPNNIRNVNMSPETLVGTAEDLDESEYTEDDCRWTYIDTRPTNVKKESDPRYEKVYFLKPSVQEGFMTQVVDDLMGMKDAYDGTELYDAVKRIVNSVYGVYGDSESYGKGYRLFDWRIAEGITLGGRKMIQDSSERFVDALNAIKSERNIDGNRAYRVGGDTDSVMTAIPFMEVDYDNDSMIQMHVGDGEHVTVPAYYEDFSDIVDVAHDAADRVNEWYGEWAEDAFNITDGRHYCELEIESYAPRAFIPEGVTKKKAKKRYAEIIAWDEGDWKSPPEFSVTGIDIVRSDRAPITREVLEDVLDIILREDGRQMARAEVYDTINQAVAEVMHGERPHSDYARPRGMSKHPSHYGSPTDLPMPTYKGAKYANAHFDWERLTAGDKPALLYIEDVRGSWPSTYPSEWDTKEAGDSVDAIAVNEPDELPAEFRVDKPKMVEKTLEDPLTPILSPMRWDFDSALDEDTYRAMRVDQDQQGLGQFS